MRQTFTGLVLLFINITTVYSADCKALFDRIDKQHYQISTLNRSKQLIAIEDSLFKAIDKCRNYSRMFTLMGEVQIDMGQIPLAVVYGRKAVEMDSKDWRAHKLLGSASMLNNEFETGLNFLRKSVELNPTNTNVQLNLVSALVQNKKYDEGMRLVNKVIEKNEEDTISTAYYLRSLLYKGKGLIIEADKDLKTAQRMGFSLQQH